MQNKLIYFTIISVFLVLITGISAANPGISVAYVYSSDISSANSYKSLLDSNQLPTSLIFIDDAANSDFSKYDVIIVGSDIVLTGSKDDASLASAINNFGKPIVALGEGGYSFFGQLKLNTGSPYGWQGSTNSVYVLDVLNPIFNKPYTISVPGNNIIQLYTSTGHVGIYLPSIPSNVVPVGRESTDPNHYPLTLEDKKYFLWGFTGSPDTMTDDGKYLFVNVINYMSKLLENPSELGVLNSAYDELTSDSPGSSISVISTPEGAKVTLVGESYRGNTPRDISVGETPTVIEVRDVKKHKIRLEKQGYDIWEGEFQFNILKENEPKKMEVFLNKIQV